MSQSRRMSAVESVTNVVVGLGVSFTTQVVAFPLFGLDASPAVHAGLSALFTAVSLVRSYTLRRLFERLR